VTTDRRRRDLAPSDARFLSVTDVTASREVVNRRGAMCAFARVGPRAGDVDDDGTEPAAQASDGSRGGGDGALLLMPGSALSNHPVLVEGNCNNPGGVQPVTAAPAAGTCGDYDGDSRIGGAEDQDGDRVFRTLNAANGPLGTNNNGTITIVTSGLFPETLRLQGNVTLEAAPGVEANLDAVRQGDPGSTARQGEPGIVVNAPRNRHVVIRNIQSRNWTSGIRVEGVSRVSLIRVRAEHNVNYGIEVTGLARAAITGSEISGTGFRLNPMAGDFPLANRPDPGRGIEFDDRSSGTVVNTTVAGSFGSGIADRSRRAVCAANVNVFDNGRGIEGPVRIGSSCVGARALGGSSRSR
jgi:hypothetical protein